MSQALPIAIITLNRTSKIPLYQQIYQCLSEAILNGQLVPGLRLPSTRELSKTLSVSRNTVMLAFEQLLAEGYLVAGVGSGTYITHTLPDELLQTTFQKTMAKPLSITKRQLSKRGEILARTTATISRLRNPDHVFTHGLPAVEMFPFDIWMRLTARHYRDTPPQFYGYDNAVGYWPLRAAIATYLNMSRAVNCTAEQVIICAGSQQALDLAARLLLDPHDVVWMENPGYMGARAAFIGAEARVIPIPIDEEGIDLAAGQGTTPRLIYVTPSHQFPVGVTMTLTRRLNLLHQSGGWILEDDYDSEFRYEGRPIPSLQGLDTEGRVIYLGTFSKVLFPALRIGYLVVPSDLVDAFTQAQSILNRGVSSVAQAVLAEFIQDGHLARHIRRMRVLYEERRDIFREAAEKYLGGFLELGEMNTGMHTVGWLPTGMSDEVAYQKAAAIGIETIPLSAYGLGKLPLGGLVLGYAAATPENIVTGMKRLAQALESGFFTE